MQHKLQFVIFFFSYSVFYISHLYSRGKTKESEKCKFAGRNAAAQIWCYWKFFEFSTNICRSTSPAWIKQKHERNHSETSVPKCIQPNYGYLSSSFIEFFPLGRSDLPIWWTNPLKRGQNPFHLSALLLLIYLPYYLRLYLLPYFLYLLLSMLLNFKFER